MTGFGMNLDAAQASVESAPPAVSAAAVGVEPARPDIPPGRATIDNAMLDRARAVVQGLRDLADFLEARPELAGDRYFGVGGSLSRFNPEGFADAVRLIGGEKYEKTYGATPYIGIRRSFGPVSISCDVTKEMTCERVQVGTRTVEREVYPADVVPTIETVEEPVFEWKCPPSFLALEGSHDRLV